MACQIHLANKDILPTFFEFWFLGPIAAVKTGGTKCQLHLDAEDSS